jgi:hypothetical protein
MQSGFPELARWANYYEIVGSSAGALTGLQFVVMALLTQTQRLGSRHEIRAFGTPTVVHFGAALLISAMMSGPWNTPVPLGICLAALGAAGFVYCLTICRHTRKQTGYSPDVEDWFWYAIFPLLAYVALGAGGLLLSRDVRWSLVVIAVIVFLFLVIGIHNAWDTATYVVLKPWEKKDEPKA